MNWISNESNIKYQNEWGLDKFDIIDLEIKNWVDIKR